MNTKILAAFAIALFLVASPASVQAAPSGTLTASPNPCIVSVGQTNCVINYKWNTIGASDLALEIQGIQGVSWAFASIDSNSSSGTFFDSKKPGEYHTYILRSGGRTGTEIARVTVAAVCATGTVWDPYHTPFPACVTPASYDGEINPQNTYTPPKSTPARTTSAAIGVTVNPISYLATLPDHAIKAVYTLTNGTSSNTRCRLLNNLGAALTAYAPCTGGLPIIAPAAAGVYGYAVQANQGSTGQTATSNKFTVRVAAGVNPAERTCTSGGSWDGADCVPDSVGTIPGQPTISVAYSPNTVPYGGKYVVSWETTKADSVEWFCNGPQFSRKGVALATSGSFSAAAIILPNGGTLQCTWTARNSAGAKSAAASLSVLPPSKMTVPPTPPVIPSPLPTDVAKLRAILSQLQAYITALQQWRASTAPPTGITY
ncbi:hypothetical protein HY972_02135 [Candidatus Kaiserbacteria bacterium]|nr:hypothetical protein [Candidatus Kaiserbacteria bacterium]